VKVKGLGDTISTYVKTHRAAVGIVGAAVAALVVWKAATGLGMLHTGAPAASVSTRPAATAPHPMQAVSPTHPATGQVPGAGGAAGGTAAGATASGQPASGQGAGPAQDDSAGAVPGAGRSDPFSPLETAGPTPPGGGRAMPPIPPLPPGAGQDASLNPAQGGASMADPQSRFKLVGIVNGAVPVAILNDATGSYIAQPGDTVVSTVRLVAVDADARRVTLAWNDQLWQLSLTTGGGTSR
jgi:hypothetical protein